MTADSDDQMTSPTAMKGPSGAGDEAAEGLNFPDLVRRYLAAAVDGMLLSGFFLFVSYVLIQGEGRGVLRAGIVAGVFLAYEPICTSRFCTAGQALLGIRVRRNADLGKISLGHAYLRIFIKILLGWLSFLTIGFSERRRAIHDMAASSVMVTASSLRG